MRHSLIVHEPQWQTVFAIPQGTTLQKGRHGIYSQITSAAAAVKDQFGCYSWEVNSTIYYCGSFAKDYVRGSFKSNLQARVHNYWQNHRTKSSGRKNTNLMVFDNIASALKSNDVLLRRFTFSELTIGDKTVTFVDFSTDRYLVHAIEQLLICDYRRLGQCCWNRA
jgi:hypothetical protein